MERKSFNISSSTLHIIAMTLMFCDHLCMTLLNNQIWLHLLGRSAFPIYAFMAVEGYYHTSDIKKYLLRLLIFAMIAEIPFDYMCAGIWFYPFQQNALWTYILGILGIIIIEKTKKITKPIYRYILFPISVITVTAILFIIGQVTMVDYFGGGIVMIIIFYLFREDKLLTFEISNKKLSQVFKIINRIMQLILVWYIAEELIGGLSYNIKFFGKTVEIVAESLGVFALIPIWLYKGRKGINSKIFKYFCYVFYPLHILILLLLQKIVY